MAKILIISETNQGTVKPVTIEIMGKLAGHKVDVVVVGQELNDASKKSLAEFGAQKIHQLKSDTLKTYTPEGFKNALNKFIAPQGYDYVFSVRLVIVLSCLVLLQIFDAYQTGG